MFKENSSRYEFAAKFTHGSVYDYSPGVFMSYFGAKTLLENKVTEEVINFNAFAKNSKHTKRSKLKDGSINFSILDDDLIKNQSFDIVISFDTIQFESNYDKLLKKFFDLLKKDGMLILSVPNSKVNSIVVKNKFTEKLIKESLNKYFKNITIYYQKKFSLSDSDTSYQESYQQKSEPRISLKKIARRLYSSIDKNLNYYELHLKHIHSKLLPLKISHKQDFVPTSTPDQNDYLYFIIVCNK